MSDPKEPTPLSAELAELSSRVWPQYEAGESGMWCNLCGFSWPCGCAKMLATIDAQATEIAILKDGRCVSCMEPCNPLHPKCACIRAEIAEMEAEIAALKGALEDAWSRMDRARKSLHKDENSRWLILDTHLDRERMARVLAGKEAQGG